MMRRKLLITAGSAVVLAASLATGAVLLARPDIAAERVVEIRVKRFEYTPNEVTLEKDVPVVLRLISLDVVHGFSLPDLNVRADVAPGKPAEVRIVPRQTGRFPFHCDIFCGSGHEDLSGAVVVTDRVGLSGDRR